MQVERFRTNRAPAGMLDAVRALMDRAFDDFAEDDWDNALGGWHVVASDGEYLIAHAAVVPRRIMVGDTWFDAGYVEAMATDPDRLGEGFGTAVLEEVSDLLRIEYQLGVLSTEDQGFYEQAGWVPWQGPSFVIDAGERRRTLEEDDGIVVLPFGESSAIDPTDRIVCESRPGDDW